MEVVSLSATEIGTVLEGTSNYTVAVRVTAYSLNSFIQVGLITYLEKQSYSLVITGDFDHSSVQLINSINPLNPTILDPTVEEDTSYFFWILVFALIIIVILILIVVIIAINNHNRRQERPSVLANNIRLPVVAPPKVPAPLPNTVVPERSSGQSRTHSSHDAAPPAVSH